MANTNCLGLYIEDHIIKYAKVSKQRDNMQVETFGIKFYEKLQPAIKQIIQETYSQRIPISINLSEEMYNYFEMFSLLNKKDLQKAIKTEFESFCSEKGYNPNALESRYAIVEDMDNREKVKVIHISDNKMELNKIMGQIEGYKLTNISPISMAIPNLIDAKTKENSLIVNMEEKTTITTILQNKIYNVDVLEEGSKSFLSRINLKENSYAKSYEICKNTTIYTSEGRDLRQEEAAYLEDIMPTLYRIVVEVRNIIDQSAEKIEKVYLTGTAALINNIDLYFQEYMPEVECQILRPKFINNTREISIKDYIEVNSAISLALMGLDEGIAGMNFKQPGFLEKLPEWLKIEVGSEKNPSLKKYQGGFFTWDLGQPFDKTETGLLRIVMGLIILAIVYSTFSALLGRQIQLKEDEAKESIATTTRQIQLAETDNGQILSRTNDYNNLLQNLKDANIEMSERTQTRNAIPNLLNQLMSIVPENVQITEIQNTSGTHVRIKARSDKYEQLGYLIARIKTDSILTNVISSSGVQGVKAVTITIEGELP